ncbi:MAG: hypothetical protein ACPG49_00695 [Chitinophagales bacterium]
MTNRINNFNIFINLHSTLKTLIILLSFCFTAQSSFAQKESLDGVLLIDTDGVGDFKKKPFGTGAKKPGLDSPTSDCADLKAMPIAYQFVGGTQTQRSRSSRGRGRTSPKTRITATVKNIGEANYVSTSNPQNMLLFIGEEIVKSVPIGDLSVGQTQTLTYQYNGTLPASTFIKFATSLGLGILINRGTPNDECTYRNNQSTVRISHD